MASPRSLWKGPITCGLIACPVSLYKAVDEQDIRFATLHAKCGTRIKMPRYCPSCNEQLTSMGDTVKAYVLDDKAGKYLQVTDDELESMPVASAKTIEIVGFAPDGIRGSDALNPVWYETSYYARPDKGAEKVFALLYQGMANKGVCAFGKLAIRDREHLVKIAPWPLIKILAIHTLYWDPEIRDPKEIAISLPDVRENELAMAENLIRAMTLPGSVGEFLGQQRDSYHDELEKLINAKLAGEVIMRAPEQEPAQATDDFMAAFAASIEAAKAKAK